MKGDLRAIMGSAVVVFVVLTAYSLAGCAPKTGWEEAAQAENKQAEVRHLVYGVRMETFPDGTRCVIAVTRRGAVSIDCEWETE